MTLQISRRGREYQKTAQTLLHSANTVTDRAVADQLKVLAGAYERQAKQASHVDAVRALARAAADAEREARFEGDWT
jgi:ferredoxin-NADP reductase